MSDSRDLVGIVLVYGLLRTLLEGSLLNRFGYTQRFRQGFGLLWMANMLTVIAGSLGVFAWFYPMKGV